MAFIFIDDHEGPGQNVGTSQEVVMSFPRLSPAVVGQEHFGEECARNHLLIAEQCPATLTPVRPYRLASPWTFPPQKRKMTPFFLPGSRPTYSRKTEAGPGPTPFSLSPVWRAYRRSCRSH